jgi:predicted MFS family arabinose efflux permease
MTGVFFLVAVCSYGAISHLSPILTDRGVSVYDATMAVSVFGASALVGRVVTGWLVDRIFAPFVAAGMFAAMGIGLVLLHQGLAGAVAAGLIGVGLGAEVDVMPYLFSRYFGFRAFGEIYGITYSVFAIGFASGPYLMGIGFDLSGGYGLPLLVLMAALAVAILGMVLLPRFDEAIPDPA